LVKESVLVWRLLGGIVLRLVVLMFLGGVTDVLCRKRVLR
jgi:hypothetical protein